MTTGRARFAIGQLIHHLKYDYRGVIVDVDPTFLGTEEWYEEVARSRPPRDRPWYHVLVHETDARTYVAQRHLEADDSGEPISHPLVGEYFSGMHDGVYVRTAVPN